MHRHVEVVNEQCNPGPPMVICSAEWAPNIDQPLSHFYEQRTFHALSLVGVKCTVTKVNVLRSRYRIQSTSLG